MNYLKRKYNLLIGDRTAERIKIKIGSTYALDKPLTMEIKGRGLIEGMPKTVTVDDSEIRDALSECVSTCERHPGGAGAFSADIDRGIVLAGGGALLKDLDKQIREEPGCRYASPTTRCAAWCSAQARFSATSNCCGRFRSNRFSGVISTCGRVIKLPERTAGCPNLIWELSRAQREQLSAQQLLTSRLRKNSIRSERSTTKLSCFHNPI